MSKKSTVFKWFIVGCGSLIALVYISINLVFRSSESDWENQLATMIATDSSISAFGDDSHAVSVDPNKALKIGDTGVIFGIEITLNSAGFIKFAENVSGKWEYWFVEFTGKSILNEIQYGINPGVESQIQYLQGGNYLWDLDEFEQRQCDYSNVIDGFEPEESFHCRFIYRVPTDERSIYWVYARTDTNTDGSYEERYAVFQIR